MSGVADRISVVVVLHVQPGRRDEVERHITEFCRDVAANDPGTVTYVVVRADDDDDTLAMFEEFRDEAAVAAHSEMAAALTATLAPMLRDASVVSGRIVGRPKRVGG
ncbi:MAG: Antibiotic biosynthesis monooxygenase [Ilumatobacteraceae bacterium]|nr:Antibiotic biosynthesis monooxygenase [Ilumatobacteraceae bacterium]